MTRLVLRLAIDAVFLAIGVAIVTLVAPEIDIWKAIASMLIGMHAANTSGRLKDQDEARSRQ